MTKPEGVASVMNGLVSTKTSALCCWEENIVERLITCTLMTTLWCSALHPTDWLWLHIPQTPTVRDLEKLEASFSCQTDFPLSVRVLLRVFARVWGKLIIRHCHPLPAWGRVWIEITLVKSPAALKFCPVCLWSDEAIHGLTSAIVWPWCIWFVLPGFGPCSPEKPKITTFTLKDFLTPQ